MILNKKTIKRLSIFIFYDKDGIVDDYVIDMLDNLRRSKTEILIVSNSFLNNKEKNKLKKYTNQLFIRENIGLDAGAFKYAYDRVNLKKYDEVVIINDTFFGPFVEFSEIFNKMAKKDLDFWGLTANYKSKEGYNVTKSGYFESHIQTFFIAFRNNVLLSSVFNDYWEKYDITKMNDFFNVVTRHEVSFTNYLESSGFKWDTYTNLSHYYSDNPDLNYNIYAYSSYPLLITNNLHFIKRKNLIFDKNDSLYINNGNDAKMCLEYLSKKKIYNLDLIFKNIIRLYKYDEIYNCLNLNYLNNEINEKYDKKVIIMSAKDTKKEFIYNKYLEELKETDIIRTDDIIKYIKNNKDNLLSNYKYIGLLNIDSYYKNEFVEVDDSNIIKIIENGFKNDKYINGIVDKFERDKYLGVLMLPISFHNKYMSYLNGSINSNIKYKSNVMYNLDAVWFKAELLKYINYDLIDINSFIANIPESAKKINCYVGKIYNEEYAKNDLISYETMLNMIIDTKEKIEYPKYARKNGLFRNLARKYISFKIRKKILDILGIKK